MLDLTRLTSFVALVNAGSFTSAAKALGLTKAAVSLHVRKLEEDLGATLVVRTSRRVEPTEAGLRLHSAGTALLAEAERVEGVARDSDLAGTLRIASTNEFLSVVLAPIFAAFVREHPRLRLELFGAPNLADVVAERYDLAIRFGQPASSALRATKLGAFRLFPVAAPSLIARCGLPKHPRDLSRLPWVTHRRHPNPIVWQRGEERLTIPIHSRIVTDVVDANRNFALSGEAAILAAEWRMSRDIAEGHLVHLIPDWTGPTNPIYAVRPPAPHVPTRVRALLQRLREALATLNP